MNSNELTPIALFTYKRLETLKLTIQALQKNNLAIFSDLIIFSDAAKHFKDSKAVEDVRDYLKTIEGFNSIKIYESKENKGLANSIINGVSQVLETHDSVIVLEDDLITTSNFLDYMNSALIEYNDQKNVFSICGYSFDLGSKKNQNEAYFLNRPWPWSWATWKDRWIEIDWDMKDYETFKIDKKRRDQFSSLGSDVNAMLDKQMNGQLDSWAIRWTFHQFKTSKISLFPAHSMVFNAGFDEFATHTTGSPKRYVPKLNQGTIREFHFPMKAQLDINYQKRFKRKMGYLSRIKSKLETIFLKIWKSF
jgi:hypothetical protein